METNVTFDATKFLRSSLEDMRDDISYAYPKLSVLDTKGTFDQHRAHAALQMVGSKIEVLTNFLNSIEQKPKAVEMAQILPPLPMIERRAVERV
jgi:hypothetical protein